MTEKITKTTRTRKPKNKMYFGKPVQDAIIKFNNSDSYLERSELYKNIIHPAFMKLTENVINTWKFNRYETTFSDLQIECVSHLFSKIDGYDCDKGKAYSYFTIVSKNFLLATAQKLYSDIKNSAELIVVDEERDLNYEKSVNNYQDNLSDFLYKWCNWCELNSTKLFKSKKDGKILESIIYLFRNNSDIDFINKKMLYLLIRERSGVDTQHITKVVNVLKNNFYKMFNEYQKNGFVNSDTYI
jgi:hypothetical protein